MGNSPQDGSTRILARPVCRVHAVSGALCCRCAGRSRVTYQYSGRRSDNLHHQSRNGWSGFLLCVPARRDAFTHRTRAVFVRVIAVLDDKCVHDGLAAVIAGLRIRRVHSGIDRLCRTRWALALLPARLQIEKAKQQENLKNGREWDVSRRK